MAIQSQQKGEVIWDEVVMGYCYTPVVNPAYKLIGRNGIILDVNADPRNLEGLVRLLERYVH